MPSHNKRGHYLLNLLHLKCCYHGSALCLCYKKSFNVPLFQVLLPILSGPLIGFQSRREHTVITLPQNHEKGKRIIFVCLHSPFDELPEKKLICCPKKIDDFCQKENRNLRRKKSLLLFVNNNKSSCQFFFPT